MERKDQFLWKAPVRRRPAAGGLAVLTAVAEAVGEPLFRPCWATGLRAGRHHLAAERRLGEIDPSLRTDLIQQQGRLDGRYDLELHLGQGFTIVCADPRPIDPGPDAALRGQEYGAAPRTLAQHRRGLRQRPIGRHPFDAQRLPLHPNQVGLSGARGALGQVDGRVRGVEDVGDVDRSLFPIETAGADQL